MGSQFINILQIVLAILLTVLILLQAKGTGLGSAFGSELGFYSTKRGAEKLLFVLTIIVAALFLALSLMGVVLGR